MGDILGFEKPGITGGVGSPLALPPLLLGGVLNGDTSAAASEEASGASVDRTDGSVECDLFGTLGFPARLTGGGIGGAEATGRSPLRGSTEATDVVFEGK